MATARRDRDLRLHSIDDTPASTNQPKESVMKALAKVLAPASLALAAFSANAGGLIEIDYPAYQGDAAVTAPAVTAPASAAAANAREVLSWPISEAAPAVHSTDAMQTHGARDAMPKTGDAPLTDTRYFA